MEVQTRSQPLPRRLAALREQVMRMGHLAEAILDKSLQSVWTRDGELAANIEDEDLRIDRLDIDIDRGVLEFLALQAPVARDLRQVIAIKTVATDLERVGDLSRNIARSAMRLAARTPVTPPAPLKTLAGDSQRALRKAIACFADNDPDVARQVLASDDRIDADQDQAIRDAIEQIRRHPEVTEQALDFIFIARSLERVGDHATNIAEDVILVAESLNLKHAEKL